MKKLILSTSLLSVLLCWIAGNSFAETEHGLYGLYYKFFNPVAINPDTVVATNRVDPEINFNWGNGMIMQGANTWCGITWNGKIIVPETADYTFRLEAVQSAILWIDNRYACCSDWGVGKVHLEKGEHKIRLQYDREQKNSPKCILRWSSPSIPEQVIPSSVLLPEVFTPSCPAPWLRARSFRGAKGMTAFNSDGTITISGGGKDFAGKFESNHFLWKAAKGDFDLRITYRHLENMSFNNPDSKLMILARDSVRNNDGALLAAVFQPKTQIFSRMQREWRNQQPISQVNSQTSYPDMAQEGTLRLVRRGNNFRCCLLSSEGKWIDYVDECVNYGVTSECDLGIGVSSSWGTIDSFLIKNVTFVSAPKDPIIGVVDGKLMIGWTPGTGAEAYKIKIRGNDGVMRELDFTLPSNVTYYDLSAFPDTLSFQVGMVREGETIWSGESQAVSSEEGKNHGLYAVYYRGYNAVAYTPDFKVTKTGIDPTVNFDWGTGALTGNGDSDYCGATWNGLLRIPETDSYTFTLSADDTALLWIDNRLVSYSGWNKQSKVGGGNLEKGEHSIRVQYNEDTGAARCKLEWSSSAISKGVLPPQFLTPVEFSLTPPEPWTDTRSFANARGLTLFNTNGTVTISGGGKNLYLNDEGHHYLWRDITGDFDFRMTYSLEEYKDGAAPNSKLFILARSSTTLNQPLIAASFYPRDAKFGELRRVGKGQILEVAKSETFPGLATTGTLRLARKEGFFHFYVKSDGRWVEYASPMEDLFGKNAPLLLGPAVTTDDKRMETFTLSNITLHVPPKAPRVVRSEGKITLFWEAGEGGQGYRIQVRGKDGVVQELDLTLPLETLSYDLDPSTDIATFRVGSLLDGDVVWSNESEFLPGEGWGLHTEYTENYNYQGFDPLEKKILALTNGWVNFYSKKGPVAHSGRNDRVYMSSNGKLIIPITGDYTFYLYTDDGGALWIDDKPIINFWLPWIDNGRSNKTSAPVRLEGGEHDIRLDYFEKNEYAFCILRWSSSFLPKNDIFSSQLIPVPIRLPAPWVGERTLNQNLKGHSSFDTGAGTLTLQGGGDLDPSTGMHFLWTRSSRESFDLSFRYRWHPRKMGAADRGRICLVARKSLMNGAPLISASAAISSEEGGATAESHIRESDNAPLVDGQEGISLPGEEGWLRLVRIRNTFLFYFKEKGNRGWSKLRGNYIDEEGTLSGELLLGPAVSSNGGGLHAFTLSDISLRVPSEATVLVLR